MRLNQIWFRLVLPLLTSHISSLRSLFPASTKAPSDAASEARDRTMERARKNTLKMTISIVVTFILCWTPYAVIVLWYQLHRKSAEAVPGWLTSALFIFAFSSSCLNPFLHSRHLFDCSNICGPRTTRTQRRDRAQTNGSPNSHTVVTQV